MKEYQKALEEIESIPNEEVSNSKRIDQARNYIYAKTGRLSEISGEFYSIEQAKNYSKEEREKGKWKLKSDKMWNGKERQIVD